RVTLDREILNVGIDHAEEDIGPPVGPSSNWCETHCMPRGPTTWSLFCDHNGSVAFRGRRQVWILETVRVDPSKFDSGIVQYSDGLGPGNISDCRVNTYLVKDNHRQKRFCELCSVFRVGDRSVYYSKS